MQYKDGLQLADLIQVLRSELERAQAQSENAEILFQTEKVELELKVAVTGTIKGEGGVKFWVINAGGGLESSSATTHTFKLTLTPVSKDSKGPILVSEETDKEPVGASNGRF
jgi:hypothetical protein